MKVRGVLLSSQSGQSVVEYAILAAVVALPTLYLSDKFFEALLSYYSQALKYLTVYINII